MSKPMTQKELIAEFKRNTEKMIQIMEAKNADYSGDTEDALKNFSMIEEMTNGAVTAEMGFMTLLTSKTMRIGSFIKAGTYKVEDEKIEDTLLDLANYALLMLCYRTAQWSDGEGEIDEVEDYDLVD